MARTFEQESAGKQAANALWNAAGRYGFKPPAWQVFLRGEAVVDTPMAIDVATTENLRPKTPGRRALLYRNTASGLIWKWFDGDAVCAFARSWETDFRAAYLDELCWLAFSEAACQCELPHRPALRQLHDEFLKSLPESGRAALDQLGCGNPGLRQDDIVARIQTVARARYRFDGRCVETPDESLHLGVSLLGLSLRADADKPGREKLRMRSGSAISFARPGNGPGAVITRILEERDARKAHADRAYVQRCFGPLLCSPAQLEQLERAACTGVHARSRLWLADGSRPPGSLDGHEFRMMQADAGEQLARNRAFYAAGRRAYDATIEKLARSLGDRLRSTARFSERGHCLGTLDARAAWRVAALDDGNVFLKKVPLDDPQAQVDLLLDASGSRSEQQEAIAAQAYILGQALARCRIPVRISAFCSLRDHTVIRVFCGYDDAAGMGDVMRYFAAGMNRDGLALRAMGQLMDAREARGRQRLLLVLTDGSPMDDHALAGTEDERRRREYLGKPAVRDTAAQVRALRREGIQVAALYQGPDDYWEHARLIYGFQLVRIHRIERMAEAAALLVASTLES